MTTSKDDIYYVAGRQAYRDGLHMRDKPAIYLTDAWEKGFIDELAEAVRGKAVPKP